jgi:hypothetical protein
MTPTALNSGDCFCVGYYKPLKEAAIKCFRYACCAAQFDVGSDSTRNSHACQGFNNGRNKLNVYVLIYRKK